MQGGAGGAHSGLAWTEKWTDPILMLSWLAGRSTLNFHGILGLDIFPAWMPSLYDNDR